MTQLRDLSSQYDLGPSTFAQRILVSFIRQAEAPGERKDIKDKKIVSIDEIFNTLMEKSSQTVRSQLMYLTLNSVKGELDNPSSISIDKSKIAEWMETSMRFLASLAEAANPNIKVITPFDKDDKSIMPGKGKEETKKQIEI